MTENTKSFNDLALPAPIAQAVEKLQYKQPTPIQAAAIPLALTGRDLIACAQTGTGKTVAFVIPLLSKILENPKSRALIVTPTRELANQVADVVYNLTEFCTHIRSTALIGGASINRQIGELRRNPQVVIGTPGRLVDHMERRSLDFRMFNTIVLDEADRMLDMGFADSMNEIFRAISENRQTLLFSATFSPEVSKLARKYLNDPEKISIGAQDRPIERIKQTRVDVVNDLKNPKLLEEIQKCNGQILVFVRTKQRTDRVARFLKDSKIKAAPIHGGRTQSQREHALELFRAGEYQVLCATDVASRGLDIPAIRTVFNFDLPETAEDYIHRIGRTARAGAEGEAISFVTPEENRHWGYLTKIKGGEKMTFQRGKKQHSRRDSRRRDFGDAGRGGSGGGKKRFDKFRKRERGNGGYQVQRKQQG